MKFNWGYKIVTFYVVFVIGIMVLVFKSASQKVDLVATDYYEQELKYQQKINARTNSGALSSPLIISCNKENVQIILPAEMKGKTVTANILMYCPSDNTNDHAVQLSTTDALFNFNMKDGTKGLFVAKVNWSDEDKLFYGEQKINFK